MYTNDQILVGKSDKKELSILLKMANRHGLITGARVSLTLACQSFWPT